MFWPFLFSGDRHARGLIAGAAVPWSDIIIVGIGGLVMAVALIGIFIFKGFWKKRVTEKVRSIHEYGMNLNDLNSMKKTGLLTEDEYALIKQRQTEKIREEIEQERKLQAEKESQTLKMKPKAGIPASGMDPKMAEALAREGSPLKGGMDARSVEDQLRQQIAAQGGEAPTEPMPALSPKQRAGKRHTQIDAEDLLKRGMITIAEYQQIKKTQGGE